MPTPTIQGRWFLHMGMPKTGSTFFQQSVYPHFRGARFFSKPLLQYLITARPDETLIVCEETLLRHRDRGPKEVLVPNMGAMFPDATPILTVREHRGYFRSAYNQHIKTGGTETFPAFFENAKKHWTSPVHERFYRDIIACMKSSFSREPIILIYEDFAADPRGVIQVLADAMQVNVDMDDIPLNRHNASIGERQSALLRSLNRCIGSRTKPGGPLKLNLRHKSLRRMGFDVESLVRHVPDFVCARFDQFIDPQSLARIGEQFADDWQYCLDVAMRPESARVKKSGLESRSHAA